MSAKTQAQAALAKAIALKALLVDEGSTWPRERVERQVARVRADLDAAVHALRSEYGVDAHQAVDGFLQVAVTLLDLVVALNAGKPRVVSWTMPHAGNAALAAFWRYQDVSRRGEIVALNHLADPNRIEAGRVLKVLER